MSEPPGGEIILYQRDGANKMSHRQTMDKAATEYPKCRAKLSEQSSEVKTAYLETVKAAQKEISTREKS